MSEITSKHHSDGDGTPSTKGARTRQAILDAAIDRFAREGFRGTSVADIARDAAVSGTAAYAYFPNKEALFLAAIDEDAAGVIRDGLSTLDEPDHSWRENLIFALVDAVEGHPLARRVLAGLEPEVTERVLDIPAIAELRKACGELIASEQLAGRVRGDIDPTIVGNGVVTIMLALLKAVVQVGPNAALMLRDDVVAVFDAALDPPNSTR